MEKNINPKDRIIEVATKLFYENGYAETGINEILNNSSTFKKTFYTHFSSKTELGIYYLTQIENELLNLSEKLLSKYSKFDEFIKAWMIIIRNKLSKDYNSGCPLANISSSSIELSNKVRSIFQNLKNPFTRYFQKNYKLPLNQCIELSEEILFLYEGAMNSYKLDSSKKYFQYMEKHLEYIYQRLNNMSSI
ncbi:MAG: TetR/AcrR family transcriptional regulator [Leptospiraceae bacterium]|nr:TetR/AcrR family transcriptional regulator [Leptospiraceae bacterium]